MPSLAESVLPRAPRLVRAARPALLALALAATGCATVRQSHIRPDYETEDRTKTLRLNVVTAPLPDGSEAVGRMWSVIARRYVNSHRDFIVRADTAAPALVPVDACAGGHEGVLHLLPRVDRRGGGVDAEVEARLFRCRDGETVWRASAGGSWSSDDSNLREVTERYVETFGEEVRPYVAPTFHLLRATLDTLPKPHLPTEEDEMEKIELGE